MKFLVCLFAIAAASNNITLNEVFSNEKIPKLSTLEQAYGHPKQQVGLKQLYQAKSYRFSRTLDNCTFPLEIVILQDGTASFEDDFAEMKNTQLDLMVNGLASGHPNSKFGVVSFRDKPVWSLGSPDAGDYCLKFEAPLSSNVTALKTVYETLVSNGGADPSESQFTAIVAAAQSNTVGWSSVSADEVTRLIVVATDAPPHFADDGLNSYGMRPFSGTFDEANADTQCLAQYYPSPAQVKAALNARNAYLAVLVYDGAWWNELPANSWQWMNSYLGQPNEFVTSLTADSSNFWEDLNHVILAIEQLECVAPTPTEDPSSCPLCESEPCGPCGMPAVEILLKDRPSHLRLQIDNDEGTNL